jgi:hypothetical protein
MARALAGTAALVLAVPAAPASAAGGSADPPPFGDSRSPTRTAKERLSGKAADEQRVDNCKVPPEQRGSKRRPDACGTGRAQPR